MNSVLQWKPPMIMKKFMNYLIVNIKLQDDFLYIYLS